VKPQPLGNCTKCGNRLAVRQQNKYRLAGDQRILLDEAGKDLRQDDKGRLSGRPAREWVVVCSDCEREYRDHPHQKELDAASERVRTEAPPPPVFMGANHHTELSAFDLLDRRITALEASLSLLQHSVDKQLADLIALAKGGKNKPAAVGKG
jgi:hypothetical protein